MALSKGFLSSFKRPEKRSNPFIDYFMSLEKTPDFPLELSYQALEELEKTANSQEELMEFLLEDITFTSIYATFYEELLLTLRDNTNLTHALINKFSDGQDHREQMIAGLSSGHANYIMNGGRCGGCSSCANHQDVKELLAPWNNEDIDFFVNLYLGMQTIQFAFEQTIYDFIPENTDSLFDIDRNMIFEFRQHVYSYSQNEGSGVSN